MKAELNIDTHELEERITERVIKALKPLLDGTMDADTVFMIEDLCVYLKVEPDWVYKRTAQKEIPYLKVGGFLRFRKRDIDKWLDTCKTPAVNPLSARLKRVK